MRPRSAWWEALCRSASSAMSPCSASYVPSLSPQVLDGLHQRGHARRAPAAAGRALLHLHVRPYVDKGTPRGFGQFALQHAPPAPDQAQGSPQPRSASANWQMCSGWPYTGPVFPHRCGPPPMLDRACKPNLAKLGHAESNIHCF